MLYLRFSLGQADTQLDEILSMCEQKLPETIPLRWQCPIPPGILLRACLEELVLYASQKVISSQACFGVALVILWLFRTILRERTLHVGIAVAMSDRFHLRWENGSVYEDLAGMRRIISEDNIAWWKERDWIVDVGHTAIPQAVDVMAIWIRRNSRVVTVLINHTKKFIKKSVQGRVSESRLAKGSDHGIPIAREKVQTSESRDSPTETVTNKMEPVVREARDLFL
jgi:hypothetical protein